MCPLIFKVETKNTIYFKQIALDPNTVVKGLKCKKGYLVAAQTERNQGWPPGAYWHTRAVLCPLATTTESEPMIKTKFLGYKELQLEMKACGIFQVWSEMSLKLHKWGFRLSHNVVTFGVWIHEWFFLATITWKSKYFFIHIGRKSEEKKL